jgi:hypothetical protein
MDETPHLMPNTASGRPHGTPGTQLRLPDLPDFKLGTEGDLNGFDATDSEFLHFVQSLVPLTGENLEHWTWEERRDFLNWCLDEQVLTIQEGRLVPAEEKSPTVSLLNNKTEGDAPRSPEDVEGAHDGERAMVAPDTHASANELVDTSALQRNSESQPVLEALNAQQSTEEGPGNAL